MVSKRLPSTKSLLVRLKEDLSSGWNQIQRRNRLGPAGRRSPAPGSESDRNRCSPREIPRRFALASSECSSPALLVASLIEAPIPRWNAQRSAHPRSESAWFLCLLSVLSGNRWLDVRFCFEPLNLHSTRKSES